MCPYFPNKIQLYTLYRELTPLELFELFFDDELLEEITEQSNLYTRQKSIFESSLGSNEITLFFGILILAMHQNQVVGHTGKTIWIYEMRLSTMP